MLASNGSQVCRGSCRFFCPRPLHTPSPPGRLSRKATQRIQAVGWDPEGLLRAPQGGHISRRILQKEVEQNKEMQEELEKLKREKSEELERQREARHLPETHAQIVEYFLETESGEMQFEAARLRPLLTDDFLSYLSSEINEVRFAATPNEDRLAELEGLRSFLQDAINMIDARAQEITAPAERMKKLLTAPDKRAMLLDMAGNNEIDKPLLALLQQNIDAARAAGQIDPAVFMEKVRDAARKYVLAS